MFDAPPAWVPRELGTIREFAGPGGPDVYGPWLVHHYYDREDAGAPKLSVRRLRWHDGWPELGDPLSGSSGPGHGPA